MNRFALLLAVLLNVLLSVSIVEAQEIERRVVEDGGSGVYPAVMVADASLPTHTLFRPDDLSVFGGETRLPIVVWGNGACFNSPWEHMNFLSELASHGYLVVAIGTMPKEHGEQVRDRSVATQLLDGLDWAIAQNETEGSPYYQRLDVKNVGVSGMSCGGLQALEVAPDPRFKTLIVCNSGLFIEGTSGMPGMPQLGKEQLKKLHMPTMYLLGGPSDIAYANGMDDVKRIEHVPVFVANLNVGHGGTYAEFHGGAFAKVATAWFEWHLKGNSEASKLFLGEPCGLASWPGWVVDKKNFEQN